MKSLFVAMLVLMSANAFAGDSITLKGPLSINGCSGKAYVLYAPKADAVSVQVEEINAMVCDTISFYSQSGQRISDLTKIKYEGFNVFTTKNFTLPEDVDNALMRDCKVIAKIGNSMFFDMGADSLLSLIPIELPDNECHKTNGKAKKIKGTYYQLSGEKNCKLMKSGDYVKNVDDDFCAGANTREDVVRYRMDGEHCKRVVNGKEQANAVKKAKFCEAKH